MPRSLFDVSRFTVTLAITALFAVRGANGGNPPPRLLPAAEPASPRARLVSLQKSKPAGRQPQDSKYEPKPIGGLSLETTLPDLTKKVKKPDLDLKPTPPRGAYKTVPGERTETVWLHNPGGGWIDNTLQGPVAPFCYLPTYFEDRSLERFGCTHGHCTQPFYSTAEFFVRVPLLPYLMGTEPPWRHRPPNYLPPPVGFRDKTMHYARNISATGVGVETAAVIGLFLLIP